MRRLLGVVGGCFLALIVWTLVVEAQQPPSGQSAPPQKQMPQRGERHPEIRAALQALRNAEQHLQEAAHDYGGHRVKAMELIKQAEEELRAGLAWDRTHEQQGGQPGSPTKP